MDVNDDSVQAFMQKVHSTSSMIEVWKLAKEFFAQFGAERLIYHHEPPAGSPYSQDTRVIADGFPDDWVKRYIGNYSIDLDPILNLSRTQNMPFRWSSVERLTKLSPQQAAYFSDMSAANLCDGLAVPVFGPGGRNGYVGLGFDNPADRFEDYMLREIQWACQIAHFKYCELLAQEAVTPPDLSPREREVLQWVARGKSNTTIAEIVGISANTVDTHLRRIYSKLDVSDRTTAAIRGIGAGLIH